MTFASWSLLSLLSILANSDAVVVMVANRSQNCIETRWTFLRFPAYAAAKRRLYTTLNIGRQLVAIWVFEYNEE